MSKLKPIPAEIKAAQIAKREMILSVHTRDDVITFLEKYCTHQEPEDVMKVEFSMFGDRTADEFHAKLNEMDPNDPYNWNVIMGYFKRVWN